MSEDEEDEKQINYPVEIEVETFISESDDEDEENVIMLTVSNKKKSSNGASGIVSPLSEQKPMSSIDRKKTERERMDHLELFSFKMNKKFSKIEKAKKIV